MFSLRQDQTGVSPASIMSLIMIVAIVSPSPCLRAVRSVSIPISSSLSNRYEENAIAPAAPSRQQRHRVRCTIPHHVQETAGHYARSTWAQRSQPQRSLIPSRGEHTTPSISNPIYEGQKSALDRSQNSRAKNVRGNVPQSLDQPLLGGTEQQVPV